jgi:hypothetical protein
MAAKKPVVQQEKVRKSHGRSTVKIPKQVTSSPDKIWRRAMIAAIHERAARARHSNVLLDKDKE